MVGHQTLGFFSELYIRFNQDMVSGTSHSTPIVAAAASLVLAVNPSLKPPMVKEMLKNSANVVDGNRYLDLLRALK